VHHQIYGHLLSLRASPPFDRYQVILLGDGHTGVSSLPKAIEQWCSCLTQTHDHMNHNSSAFPIASASHRPPHCTWSLLNCFCTDLHIFFYRFTDSTRRSVSLCFFLPNSRLHILMCAVSSLILPCNEWMNELHVGCQWAYAVALVCRCFLLTTATRRVWTCQNCLICRYHSWNIHSRYCVSPFTATDLHTSHNLQGVAVENVEYIKKSRGLKAFFPVVCYHV